MNRRTRPQLRACLDEKMQRGFEIVSRDPITLRRVGCGTQYELRNGVLIQSRVPAVPHA